MTRKQTEVDELLSIAVHQIEVSRARDYWEGIEDALRWMLGTEIPSLEAHLTARRERGSV